MGFSIPEAGIRSVDIKSNCEFSHILIKMHFFAVLREGVSACERSADRRGLFSGAVLRITNCEWRGRICGRGSKTGEGGWGQELKTFQWNAELQDRTSDVVIWSSSYSTWVWETSLHSKFYIHCGHKYTNVWISLHIKDGYGGIRTHTVRLKIVLLIMILSIINAQLIMCMSNTLFIPSNGVFGAKRPISDFPWDCTEWVTLKSLEMIQVPEWRDL